VSICKWYQVRAALCALNVDASTQQWLTNYPLVLSKTLLASYCYVHIDLTGMHFTA